MSFFLSGNTFSGNKVAISAPESAHLVMHENKLVDNEVGLDIRKVKGLPPGTPVELIDELVATLKEMKAAPNSWQQKAFLESRLANWLLTALGTAADVVTLWPVVASQFAALAAR